MARRRGEDGMPIDDMENGFQGGGFMGGLEGLLGGGDQSPAEGIGAVKEPTLDEGVNMTGNGQPIQGDGSTGSTTTAREMGPKSPTTFGLPQGVSVNDSQSDDAGQSHWSHVPEMPNEPTPMSSQSVIPQMGGGAGQAAQPPMMASGEGPQRRSQSSPAIFSEQRGSQLFGRADGLLGGGKGYAGAQEASGPLEPTEMFKKLLQMFGRQ